MKRRFAVIEVKKRERTRGGPFIASAGAKEVKIHSTELNESEIRDLSKNPDVEDYGLIMPMKLINPVKRSIPVVTGSPETAWGIGAVGADRSNLDGSGVVVAVLDTGINRSHPAFAGVDIDEEDFGGSGNGDKNGHGTHCAGTIFGKDIDGRRIGIARNIKKALIAKVFPDEGSGDTLAIFKAMEWAANNGANIISMSLGFDFPGLVRELETDGYPIELATSIALDHFKDNLRMFDSLMGVIGAGHAFGRGPLVMAAAGNESERARDPRFKISASVPAAAVNVISVAALRNTAAGMQVADFSNGRAKICAPGEDILSASSQGGLELMSGTSMACPHVAGLAALWWQQIAASAVRASANTVSNKILASAQPGRILQFDPDDSETGLAVAPT